ncbi:MAG TPA: hypothetical protein VFS39_02125 [Nitrospira sp.]|nr:hypothetical protein [Nitrospira sp.]
MKLHRAVMIGLALLAMTGCNGTVSQERSGERADPVVEMLHQGVLGLTGNIDELKRHLAELREIPPAADPVVQELQGLDLAAWQLHLQQWTLQRDHLAAALDAIRRAKAAPQDKAAIGSQWAERQAQFATTLDELRTHRRQLEKKRAELEAQMLEQYFK